MDIVGDFVLVRFATRSYSFMRVGHKTIIPWLNARGILYTSKGNRVFFELPEDLRRYTVVDQKLCDELRILSRELKKALHALSYMEARKFRDRMSMDEITLMIENELPLQL